MSGGHGLGTRAGAANGMTLFETVLVLSLVMLLGAVALPRLESLRGRIRTETAARHLAGLLRGARIEAGRRGATVGVAFDLPPDGQGIRLHVDGNDNGLQQGEIATGVEPPLGPAWRVADEFPGVRFAIAAELPDIGGGASLAAGSDPTRVGTANVMVFSPSGSSSGGTVYLAGPGESFAVRVLGSTGRVRVLRFEPATATWNEL